MHHEVGVVLNDGSARRPFLDPLQLFDGRVALDPVGLVTDDDDVVRCDPRSTDGELSQGASIPMKIGMPRTGHVAGMMMSAAASVHVMLCTLPFAECSRGFVVLNDKWTDMPGHFILLMRESITAIDARPPVERGD